MISLALALYATAVAGQYCGGGPTSALDSNLGPVSMEGNSESIDNTNDCPGQIGIQDLTSQIADISAGESYTVVYHVTTCGGTYTRVSAVWIDFNCDQTFSADEMLQAPTVSSSANDVITINFDVPSDAVDGESRMRVAVQERANPTLNPCDPFGYGGVKDFGITIGGSGRAGGLSGGSWFLIVVFGIFLPVYLVGGAAWQHKNGHTGVELIIHLEFWKEFPNYVKEGFAVTKAKLMALSGKGTEEYGEI
jgi:hypothetical protein